MEIKVDTKKDTHEDIRKVIEFLQNFIEKTSEEPLASGAFNMFSDNSSAASHPDDGGEEKEDESFDMKQILEPY